MSCGGAPKPTSVLDGAVSTTPAAAATPPPAAPIDPSGFRTAIDLYANRVHAGLYRDGRLIVDAGGLDFLKYIDGGWKTSWILGVKDQGRPAALVAGLSALMFLPVDSDGDGAGGTALGNATLTLFMRGLAPNQRVSLFVNEKPAGTLDVEGTLKRYDVNIPAGPSATATIAAEARLPPTSVAARKVSRIRLSPA